MATYIWNKNSQLIIYSNHNDVVLSADENVKQAFVEMQFIEKDNASAKDHIKNVSIAFLHGGDTAEQILTGESLAGKWPNRTLFVLFSSQGFQGHRPKKILGSYNTEHLVTFIQKAPLGNDFGKHEWKNVIGWSLATRKRLACSSVDEILDTYSVEEWINEVVPQKNYSENLLAVYLLDVAMTISGDDEFKTQLEKSRGDIWQDIEERAKKEFQDRGGQESDWSDIECRVAAVREIFSRIGEQRIG